MNRLFYLALIYLFASPAWADPPEGYPFQSFDQATQQATSENKPIFVYFGRFGCGYCDKTNKEAFSSPMVREVYTKNYALAYVEAESGKRLRLPNGERVTEREMGTRYNAFATPVFTFLTPKGDTLLQIIGIQSIDTLLKASEQVQEKIKASKTP